MSPQPHMASYAIYLLPKENSLQQALHEVPEAMKHVEQIRQRGHWGGNLHMTLTSFAGVNGEAPHGKRSDKMHKGDILEAVVKLAEEKIHTKEKSCHIGERKWSGGRGGKRNPDLYVFDVERRSGTLQKVLDALNLEPDWDFVGAKKSYSDLHVSFLAESNPESDAVSIRSFLSHLTWYVAAAKLIADGPDGEDLEIVKKVGLGA